MVCCRCLEKVSLFFLGGGAENLGEKVNYNNNKINFYKKKLYIRELYIINKRFLRSFCPKGLDEQPNDGLHLKTFYFCQVQGLLILQETSNPGAYVK